MSVEEKYSITTNQKLTALMVRDAMVNCFFEAHCKDAGLDLGATEEATNKEYCKSIIKKTFFDVGGDFDKPDKKHLKKVIMKLKDFSVNFRDQKMVERHASEIQSLIDKI